MTTVVRCVMNRITGHACATRPISSQALGRLTYFVQRRGPKPPFPLGRQPSPPARNEGSGRSPGRLSAPSVGTGALPIAGNFVPPADPAEVCRAHDLCVSPPRIPAPRRLELSRTVFLCLLLYFLAATLLAQKSLTVDDAAVLEFNADLLPSGYAGFSLFSDRTAVMDWVGGTLVAQAWTDRRCGDGVCDAPEEMPAWGRCAEESAD